MARRNPVAAGMKNQHGNVNSDQNRLCTGGVVSNVDAFLGGAVTPTTLTECQAYAMQWQQWYKQNEALNNQIQGNYATLSNGYSQLKVENERLPAGNFENRLRIFIAFLAIGAGLFLVWTCLKAIRHWWPLSRQRQLLITLLLTATWVSVAAVIAANDSHLAAHPINLTASVFVCTRFRH
jgi:hypothetical protein